MAIDQAFVSYSSAQSLSSLDIMGQPATPARVGIASIKLESPKQLWLRLFAVCARPYCFPRPIILPVLCSLQARSPVKARPPSPRTWRFRSRNLANACYSWMRTFASPPCKDCSSFAKALASSVISLGSKTREQVIQSQASMRSVGANLIGVVLNGVTLYTNGYYGLGMYGSNGNAHSGIISDSTDSRSTLSK